MNTEPTNPITDYTAKITEAFRKLTEATGMTVGNMSDLMAALMRQRTQLLVDGIGWVNLAPDVAATLTDRSAGAESRRIRVITAAKEVVVA